MTPTSGLINARGAKPPHPLPSPKGFAWPEKRAFTRELYERYAASLQELLAHHKQTHVDLGKTLWGVTKIGACRSTKARSWILAEGAVPDAKEAAYVADLLEVPMARLLQPESAFDPDPPMYKPRGAAKRAQRARNSKHAAPTTDAAAPAKKRPYTRKQSAVPMNGANGAITDRPDHRWVLAADAPRPHLRLETSHERPSCVRLTVTAELPLDVAMSLVQLIHENKPGPAAQLIAPLIFAAPVPPMLVGPSVPLLGSEPAAPAESSSS